MEYKQNCKIRHIINTLKLILPVMIIILCSSNIVFAAENNARSSFKWWWEDEVPKLEGIEKEKFSETRNGYVYDGAELKNGAIYDFKDQTLYIRSNINIPIPSNYKADLYYPSVTFNAKTVIVECDLNIYSEKVVFNSDLVIQNNGTIDLNSKATMDIHGAFIANSKKISKPSEGIINIYGNIELKKNWITSTRTTQDGEEKTGPTINVVGDGEHIIKGANKCSVKKLSFSSESIKNTRFKTGFLVFKNMFQINELCLEYPKKANVAQSFIDKYFICTDVEPGIKSNQTTLTQVTAKENYESFAKSFLYSLIMSSECQDSKVNIFETYYHTKKSKNDIGIYAFNIKERPIIVNNNKGELNKGTITINYIGVGQKINDNGMADIIINMENGGRCHYWFTPKLSEKKGEAFLNALRAGASDVIWDQAMDVLFSQVLSDIADLCDAFDFSKGTVVCKKIEKARFYDDLQDHIDDWNKVENGLISERKKAIPAKEEHQKGANEISSEGHSDDIQVGTEDVSQKIIPDNAIDKMLPLVNAQVNFFRYPSEEDYHVTSCKNEDDFWNTFGSYCNSNIIPGNDSEKMSSKDGKIFIERSRIIDMGYALFDDFDGAIPDTEFGEYSVIQFEESSDIYTFSPASMHDYIYKEKSEPEYNDDGTITITYLYEESFWPDRDAPETFAYDITFRVNDHVNESSDNPYYYTIISVQECATLPNEGEQETMSFDPMISTVASGECSDNITWTLDDEGTLTISGSGNMPWFFPESNAPWYPNRLSINKIIIEDGITSIGDGAFENCSNLKSIALPNSLTMIGYYAFSYCNSLTSITLPNSLTSIGDSAFNECTSLVSITLPEGITSIDSGTFYGCTKLTSIILSDGVTGIWYSAFSGCNSLKSITLPKNLMSIRDHAFEDCNSLTEIYFQGTAPNIENEAFLHISATAYYPSNDSTWTSDVKQNYGGNITWVEWDSDRR